MEKDDLQKFLDEIDLNVKEGNFSKLSRSLSDILDYGAGDIKKDGESDNNSDYE